MPHVNDHAETILVAHLDPLIGELRIRRIPTPRTAFLSATESSMDSPVVPHTNTPLMLFFTRCFATGSTASRFRLMSSFMGVCTAQQRPSNVNELGSLGVL